ncbi:hypothetical protein SPRG_13194 [Saprolegnia parasitica CBS 223.65]|uniref:ubiquitinyl hydrolase 1 n=1 Tax=Saprolegnia parasitica (strain CBS 223.65) TaxID=695850 RepID=A0A067C3D1_SAPPC|nr:hypothetical protein SPRG_13194 [Saprolegnia parasitica CBS 223.65]KDO21302.1 hypothetical protein SPRG_13194 [Saprolegnia parasitica CBS 223.65]|eukprot:XP_012207958.1 hypothetical protein SPRG_13194 [Saprolegnia parasitica CBS 223.65]
MEDPDRVLRLCRAILDDLDGTCTSLCDDVQKDVNPTHALSAIVEVVTSGALPADAEERLVTDYMEHYVQVLLARSFADTVAATVNEFFQFTLECVVSRLRIGDPSMLPTLYRLMDDNRAFYLNDAAQGDGATSELLAKNIDAFIEAGGFDAILCNLDPALSRQRAGDPATDDENEDLEYRISQPFELNAVVCAFKCVVIVKDQLATGFMLELLPALSDAIVAHVAALPADLSSVQRSELGEAVHLFEILTSPTHDHLFYTLTLEIAHKMLGCRSLEKRLHGLADMTETLKQLPTPMAVAWLDAHQVLGHLFGDTMHAELLKRAAPIFDIYAGESGVAAEHLDLVWGVAMDASKGRHEALLTTTLELLVEIVANAQSVPYVLGRVASLPIIDSAALSVLRAAARNARGSENHQQVATHLWNALKTDRCVANMDMCIQALHALLGEAMGDVFVDCFHLIQVRSSQTPEAVRAALHFLSHFSRLFSEGYRPRLTEKQCHDLQPTVLTGLLNELSEFKARGNAESNDAQEPLKCRLLALHGSWLLVVLANHGTRMSPSQLNTLWHNCVASAATSSEADLCFQWFQLCEQLLPDDTMTLLDHDLRMHIVHQFGSLPSWLISVDALECFHLLFQSVNLTLQSLQPLPGDSDEVRCAVVLPLSDLVGLSELWHLALHATGDVVETCMDHLIAYHLDVDVDADVCKRVFTDTCMGHLLRAKAIVTANDTCSDAARLVTRCVALLHRFLTACAPEKAVTPELAVLPSPAKPVDGARVLKQSVLQALNDFDAPSDDSYESRTASLQRVARIYPLPAPIQVTVKAAPTSIDNAVVNTDEYFDALFHVLEWPSPTSDGAWDLLSSLPTNRKLLDRMVLLRDSVSSAVHWESLLDTSNAHRLLYGLRIVEALLLPADDVSGDHAARRQWRERFVRLGGALHLYTAIVAWPAASTSTLEMTCLAAALRVVGYIWGLDALPSALPSRFDQQLVAESLPAFHRAVDEGRIVSLLLHTIERHALAEMMSDDTSAVVDAAMHIVVLLGARAPAYVHTHFQGQWQPWLRAIGLRCPDVGTRDRLCDAFTSFLRQHGQAMLPDVAQAVSAIALTVTESEANDAFFALATSVLAAALPLPATMSWLSASNFAATLLQHVQAHTSSERIGSGPDIVLVGLLRLVQTLVSANVVVPTPEMVDSLWHALLFGNDGVACYSELARGHALDIIERFVAQDPAHIAPTALQLLVAFQTKAVDVLDRVGRPWAFAPLDEARSSSSAAGLFNPGCTCYMNALVQQLFHMQSFRDALLSTSIDASSSAADEVRELQRVFVGLETTARKFVDPTAFCVSHKDEDGQPTDVRIQMDADEFFGVLLDRVESFVTPATLGFGGRLVNQIITEHGHVSARDEPFFALSVDVQHKASLAASLAAYVQGETLEGDNAYYCEVAQAKVKALKRVCLQSLPKTLVVHLKRFEFDFDTMEKCKLNDMLEFPTSLDMHPFTSDGLDGKAGEALYALRGVVVHSGTCDTGHYYSFLRDAKDLWVECNDQTVRPFDVEHLRDECFGGDEVVERWDASTRRYVATAQSKRRSAYMLFYDKVDAPPVPARTPPTSHVAEATATVLAENQAFSSLLHAFDAGYAPLLRQVRDALDTDISATDAQAQASTVAASILFDFALLSSAPRADVAGLLAPLLTPTADFAAWFLAYAVTELLPTAPGCIAIGEYVQRRTRLFDVVHLCSDTQLRIGFFDVALACIGVLASEASAESTTTLLANFLDECVGIFYQRDTIEVAGPTTSTVVANGVLGSALGALGDFLARAISNVPVARRLLRTTCHMGYHFGASLAVDGVESTAASVPEQLVAQQPSARVATLALETLFLPQLFEASNDVLPHQDMQLLLDPTRLCCALALGFETFVMRCVQAPVATDADAVAVVKALLSVLDSVKTSTLLETTFELLGGLLTMDDDGHRRARIEALFSADDGALEVAYYFRHHRSLHHYTYYLLDFVLTHAATHRDVNAYVQSPEVQTQTTWVRPWMWQFLQADAEIGDLSSLDGETHVVLALVEQVFWKAALDENQDNDDVVDALLIATSTTKLQATRENDDDNACSNNTASAVVAPLDPSGVKAELRADADDPAFEVS